MGNSNIFSSCMNGPRISGIIHNHSSARIYYSITTRQIVMNAKHVKSTTDTKVGLNLNPVTGVKGKAGANKVKQQLISYEFQTNQAFYQIPPNNSSEMGLKNIEPHGFLTIWIQAEDNSAFKVFTKNMPIRGKQDINLVFKQNGLIQNVCINRLKFNCPKKHQLEWIRPKLNEFSCDQCHRLWVADQYYSCIRCDFSICNACLPFQKYPQNQLSQTNHQNQEQNWRDN